MLCCYIWTLLFSGCKVDLCFVLDRSHSVTESDWSSMLNFVARFSELLSVSHTVARVGVVTFDEVATLDIPLNASYDWWSFEWALYSLPYGGSGRALDLGLLEAREQCF